MFVEVRTTQHNYIVDAQGVSIQILAATDDLIDEHQLEYSWKNSPVDPRYHCHSIGKNGGNGALHTHTHADAHTHTHTYTHAHAHMHIRTHVHTHTYTHAHAHIYTQRFSAIVLCVWVCFIVSCVLSNSSLYQ